MTNEAYLLLHAILFVGALLTMMCHADAVEENRPHGSLRTRWAKDVSSLPLPEYPRPQLRRAVWVNLNGSWDYAIVPTRQAKPETWDGKILVPFCAESSLSGVQRFVGKENRLWYRRTFEKPAMRRGQRLLLHFGGVDWHAVVWVNGTPVGGHKGGYDPFTFDITDALARGKEQTLVVSVWDPTDEGFQPRGKQQTQPKGIWYTSVTGIWQTVWLEVVPATYIERLRITPDFDNKRITVEVAAFGSNEKVSAVGQLLDGNQMVADAKAAMSESGATALTFTVPQPKLWSPDTPFLYDLKVSLRRSGRAVDAVTSYCALRKIALKKDAAGIDRVALNDDIIFQCGPLDQGWWPDGLYTAPTDDALRSDIEITKQLGFNAARKHVKIEPQRWYYWADKLGLLVWQDMPNARGSTPVGGPEATVSAQQQAQFRAELKAMMDNLYNHPCIVIWVPFNEGWGQHNTNDTIRWVKQLDPTRLVDGPSGWQDFGVGDLMDVHRYPGPAMHPPVNGRASVLSEFGGVSCLMRGHLWKEDNNWGYVSARDPQELQATYENLLRDLQPLIRGGLCAAIYTQTTDVENEVNGLLTYNRAIVKLDVERTAQSHRALCFHRDAE